MKCKTGKPTRNTTFNSAIEKNRVQPSDLLSFSLSHHFLQIEAGQVDDKGNLPETNTENTPLNYI